MEEGKEMATQEPVTTVHAQFSSPGATPTPWREGSESLAKAEIFWLATVRPDGRPHITPLLSVWMDGALYFCTGAGERKAKNLAQNPYCVLLTGCNALNEGLDLVVEGEARRTRDEAALQRLADLYAAKYTGWHFTVRDGAFWGEGGEALVYELAPATAFGFGRGEMYSQTRWQF
jgi:general stress protein 26